MKRLIALLMVVLVLSLTGCEDEKIPKDEPYDIVIYVPDENFNGLEKKEVTIDTRDASLMLEALKEEEVVSEDCELISLTADKDNVEADFNSAFGEYLRNMGTSGEYLVLGSIVNTYLDAFDSKAMHITVEGEVLETGHNVYDGYMTRFELNP